MKKLISIFLFLIIILFPTIAQNRWGIMGGANLSTTSAEGFKWKAGGYIGALYDIRLSESWYIQPQLLYSYEENETKGKSQTDIFYSQHVLTLPILVSFKVPLSSILSLRINAGPYVQYALFGRDGNSSIGTNGERIPKKLGWWHLDFGDHFTYGVKTGLTLESKHLMGTIDCKYSLKKSPLNYDGHGLTLSAGVGYKF